METQFTKGEWIIQNPRQDAMSGTIVISGKFMPDGRQLAFCSIRAPLDGKNNLWIARQTEANAKLIAEAGTVANKTGLTPRQLLEQRNELLNSLIELIDINESTEDFDTKVNRMVLAISQSKEAIKKATT